MSSQVPYVTSDEMRQVDYLAENEFFLDLKQMMENAGRGLARLSRDLFLGGNANKKKIVVLAGPGGNGGGGMAAARRLHIWGARPSVILGAPREKLAPVPLHQLRALEIMGVPVFEVAEELPIADLIIDALLGYSVKGAPRAPMDALVISANEASAPTLSLDLPTGLNPDTGQPSNPAIIATATMTLALPKVGFKEQSAKKHVGELWLADISIPQALYKKIGLTVGVIFDKDDLVRLY